jgi:hypothetical protein
MGSRRTGGTTASGLVSWDLKKEETIMTTDTELSPPEEPRTRPLPRQYTPEELREMLVKKGPMKYATFEEMIGAGAHLWDSDEEFDEFLRGIYERRKEKE